MSDTATIHLTSFDTAMGTVTLASTERGVVNCTLPGGREAQVRRWLARHLPDAEVVEGTGRNAAAVAAVKDYLAGRRRSLADVPVHMVGTRFQRKVWEQLRTVPAGGLVSYGELAAMSGQPGASRACGSANGANPLPLFTPCHRVIAADGGLGGFGGGLPLKRRLLQLEGSYERTREGRRAMAGAATA